MFGRAAAPWGRWRSIGGKEFANGKQWYGQVLQWRTRLRLHQAGRWRARCVRAHHRGRTGRLESTQRRTADSVRSRARQEGQRPEGREHGHHWLTTSSAAAPVAFVGDVRDDALA